MPDDLPPDRRPHHARGSLASSTWRAATQGRGSRPFVCRCARSWFPAVAKCAANSD